jgi:Domain of unknown function (DUF4437)
MRKLVPVLLLAPIVAVAAWAAEAAHVHGDAPHHVATTAEALKWGPGPPALPAGSQAAVLVGDPSKSEPFVMRAKLPDGYRVPPHWHPTAENVTVLSGIFHIGTGETFDTAKGEALPAGGFVSLPAEMRHYAWAEGPTVIQVHGVGPFALTYVNPADDPRTQTAPKPL